jgi:hypothetical protein
MSERTLRIGVVCEGETDFYVIRSAVSNLILKPYIFTMIQPDSSLTFEDLGTFVRGWKGVRTWCSARVEESGRLRDNSVFLNTDILILHIDADVAAEKEIKCEKPCPPPSSTTNELRMVLL